MNLLDDIKLQFKNGGTLMRLIFINIAVYLAVAIVSLILFLSNSGANSQFIVNWLAVPASISNLLYKPWTIITYMFLHDPRNIFHIISNMIMLYFGGSLFVEYLNNKRLLATYILGGIFAYALHVGAYYIFPVFANQSADPIVGASGAIMAVFMAVAFYRPSLKVMLFGVIPVPLIAIAALYIITDLLGITEQNVEGQSRIAHFAHLGGVLFGVISIIGVNKSTHFMKKVDRFFAWTISPKFSFKRKPKMKVYQNPNETKKMSDEEFNFNKKLRQERLDAILDKIGKKGYEGLTKEEKDFLFNESQRK